MARKRMFDLDIINQDSFFDLPMDAKALYFLLGMEADDEGFVSPKKVLRLYGGTEDSLKVLIAKKYIIPFETGVIVITDWKRNNYLDKNKTKPTIYQDEKMQIMYDENSQKYISLTEVKPKLNQSLEKVNVEENRIEENRIEYKERNIKERKSTKKEKYGVYGRIELTIDEYLRLVNEFGEDFIKQQIELLDEYIETNNNKNKYTNFNLVLRKSIREKWFDKKQKEKSFLSVMEKERKKYDN